MSAVIIAIVGNQGSGKTLLLTQMLAWAMEMEHREAFATYHVTFKSTRGEEVHFIDFSKFLAIMDAKEIQFKQGGAAIGIDEAYKGLDSRLSRSDANVFLTQQLNELRKRGFDAYITIQLSSRLDKSIRNQTELMILADCETCSEDTIIPEKEPPWPRVQFHYYLYNPRTWEEVGQHLISNETFREIAQTYDTQEIVKHPAVTMGREDILEIAKEFMGSDEEALLNDLVKNHKTKEPTPTTTLM